MLDRLQSTRLAPTSGADPALRAGGKGEPALIVFDGECVLCSAQAQFVLRHDREGRFRMTVAQGPVGEALYRRLGLPTGDYETMLVLRDGEVLQHSDAALAVAHGLGWPWRAALAAKILPRPIRDGAYRLVARNRYRWFGRRESCWIPTPAQADRIL